MTTKNELRGLLLEKITWYIHEVCPLDQIALNELCEEVADEQGTCREEKLRFETYLKESILPT